MRPPSATPLDAALAALAARQEGLVRRSDLQRLGATRGQVRHRVAAGRLHQVHPGVYAVGHTALTRHARFLAAVWWCGRGSALSHASAAELKGWLRGRPGDAGAPVHVSTTGSARSRPGVVVHRTRHLDRRDVVRSGLLWVTGDARTLVDLADVLAYDALRAVADELYRLPTKRIAETAGRLPGRAGAGRTRRLITSEDAHARFAMERRSVGYFARHGVPEPQRNVRVHGVLVDCWYPDAMLVLELDSRAHHTRRKEFEADRLRDRALKRHGVSTMRLVWHDLDADDPQAARDILQQLAGA